jgi:hypothetical protein
MVYDTLNQWVCGFCPPFGIVNNYKTQRFGNWISHRSQVKGER